MTERKDGKVARFDQGGFIQGQEVIRAAIVDFLKTPANPMVVGPSRKRGILTRLGGVQAVVTFLRANVPGMERHDLDDATC
jgi:hypothetical protein